MGGSDSLTGISRGVGDSNQKTFCGRGMDISWNNVTQSGPSKMCILWNFSLKGLNDYFHRHWTLRSFPSGLVTLDVMQYGKEESGEELAVTKDVRLYCTK